MVVLVPSPAELDGPLPCGVVVVPFDDSVSLGAAAAELVARFDAALVLDPAAVVAVLDAHGRSDGRRGTEPAVSALDAAPTAPGSGDVDAAVDACRAFGIPAAAAAATPRELREVAERAVRARSDADRALVAVGPEPRLHLRRAREADRSLAGLDVARTRVREARRELYRALQRVNVGAGAILLGVVALAVLRVAVPDPVVAIAVIAASLSPVVVVLRGLHRLMAAARVLRVAGDDVALALPGAGFRSPEALQARLAEHVAWNQRRTMAAAAVADAQDALATWRAFAGDVPLAAVDDVVAWADAWRFALDQRELARAGLLPAPEPPAIHVPSPPAEPVHVVVDAFATVDAAAQGELLVGLAAYAGAPVVVLTTDPRTVAWARAGGVDDLRPAPVATIHRRRRAALRRAG